MNPSQIALPVEVRPDEIARERSLGGAIELCAKVAGHTLNKTLSSALGVDKAQFSRWQNGTEGIVWPKLRTLMDFCGNEAPVLWMAHDCGFDVGTMHKRETELQRENRQLREQVEALKRVLRA